MAKNSSLVKFTVLDENDDELNGTIIKIMEYDLTTDTSKTTEIIRTDSNGEAWGNIILTTQWYKFILEINGAVVFESDPTIITTTAKTFRVTLGSDYFDDYGTVHDTTGGVTFTNSTLTFSYTFSDSTGNVNTGCLKLVRRTLNGDTQINSSCVTSSAGAINLIIQETLGSNTYIGTGYVTIGSNEYIIDTESVSFDYGYKTYGTEGIFMAMLLIILFVMVGVSSGSPSASIVLMLVGLVGTVLMTIFYLSWTALVAFIILGGITLYKVSGR
jgi:hypothetical protein